MDNCPIHLNDLQPKLKCIRLVSSSPNMTSKLQSLHRGVIQKLEYYYHWRILKKTLIYSIVSAFTWRQFHPEYNDQKTIFNFLYFIFFTKSFRHTMTFSGVYFLILPLQYRDFLSYIFVKCGGVCELYINETYLILTPQNF